MVPLIFGPHCWNDYFTKCTHFRTLTLEEGDTATEINGGDFVMDSIGERELPPAFPAKRYTLKHLIRSKLSPKYKVGQKSRHI